MRIFLKNLAMASVVIFLFSFGLCSTKDIIDSVVLNLDKNSPIESFTYTIAAAPAGVQTSAKTLAYSELNDSLISKSKSLTGTAYNLDDVLNIKLNQVNLTILSPSTVTFGVVDSATLVITAPGLPALTVFEKKFLNVASDQTASVDFSTVDFKPYLAATKTGGNISYSMRIRTNSAITSDVKLKVVPSFSIELAAK